MRARKLTTAQAIVLRSIVGGGYRPTVMDGPSLRSLVARGMVDMHAGYPPTYAATKVASAALAAYKGSKARQS